MSPAKTPTRRSVGCQPGLFGARRTAATALAAAMVALSSGVPSPPAHAVSPDTPVGDHQTSLTRPQRDRAGIAGRLSSPSGRPLAGVVVLVQSLGRPVPIPDRANATDADGHFFWPLPAGRYRLTFVSEGRTIAVRDVSVPGRGRAVRIRVVADTPPRG